MDTFENGPMTKKVEMDALKSRLSVVRDCLNRAKKLNDWLVGFRVDEVSLEVVSLHLREVGDVCDGLDEVESVAMAALRKTEEVVDGGELKFYGVEENVRFYK